MNDSWKRDIGWMGDPNKWVNWPRLTLKHRTKKADDGFPILGIMVDTGKAHVYICNLFDAITPDTPKTEYADVEALAIEWTVD